MRKSGTAYARAVVGCALMWVLPTGCGGGGSNSSSSSIPPSTTAAGHCAVAPGSSGTTASSVVGSCATDAPSSSVVTLNSTPQGLAVTLNRTSIGTTPATSTPSFAVSVNTYVIQPSNGAPAYTYLFEQRDSANTTVYYNQSADTSGSVGSIASSSFLVRSKISSVASSFTASRVRRLFKPVAGRPVYDSTHLLVSYTASALQSSGQTIPGLESTLGVTRATTIGPPVRSDGTTTREIAVPAGATVDTLASKLSSVHGVNVIGPPRMRYLTSSTPVTPNIPNDPLFNTEDQWDMYRTNMPNAWGYTTGSPAIRIAVIDTGIDISQGDFGAPKVTYAEKVLNGEVTFGTSAAVDLDGHGSNVAGIAAAGTNNNFGFAGVGYNTSLQIYRIFPDPVAPNYSGDPNYGTNTADEAQAIYDAVANGAKVINLSLGAPPVDSSGNPGFDVTEYTAVEYAISQGVVVVAAAGNDAAGVLDFPAAYQGVISVGASALNDGNSGQSTTPQYSASYPDTIASYSDYGPDLSVVAPGGDPASATDADLLHWISNDYSTQVADPSQRCLGTPCIAQIAGTSQATPHVSGAAALMLALNSGLSPAQIEQILESTADDINDSRQGHGRINLYRALAAVKGDTAPSTPTNANFVVIAYTPNAASNKPAIINVTYTSGVPVASSGAFRIADIPSGASGYKIGVWYDANGDGLVDQGDWFASTATTCSASAPCNAAQGIVPQPVPAGFVLN
jgi:subtilisin family serine protease